MEAGWSGLMHFICGLRYGFAGFVSDCDEEVVEGIGYGLWVCESFIFVNYEGWCCSGFAFVGDEGFKDLCLLLLVSSGILNFLAVVVFLCFLDSFLELVSECAMSTYVIWVWVVDGYLVQVVLFLNEPFVSGSAPWFSAWFWSSFVFFYDALYGL